MQKVPSQVQSELLQPLAIRQVVLPNRFAVSPMCEYSSVDGFASDWHLVHLGSRAVGGAGLVIAEATAVEPGGRITYADLGIWSDEHIQMLRRITDFVKSQRSVAGIQLAHAGRKASTEVPWKGGAAIPPGDPNGWQIVGPDNQPFIAGDPVPTLLSTSGISGIVEAFRAATRRALSAGFEVVEIHAAHGYLLHQFLSPLSNSRTDEYGGSFENRIRIVCEVVQSVRAEMGEGLPLFLRISATDWVEGGWNIEDSIQLALAVKPLGVDLIDTSSGGLVPHAKIQVGPGYQVPFAERIRREANILTGAVGMIITPEQAQEIIDGNRADLVLLAREFLRDPYFPMHAAQQLGESPSVPLQYLRAYRNGVPR